MANPLWKKYEYGLLALFLISKIWLLWTHWGNAVGFDGSHHIEMLGVYTWASPTADLQLTAYSYHPPLGFLLARSIFLLGIPPIPSIQIVSCISALIVFFLLRKLIRQLDLLSEPRGILFLYLTNAVPLLVFMSVNINLDIIILAATVAVLMYSVQAYWKTQTKKQQILLHIWIFLILVFSMFVKFSGLLLLGIPALVAILSPNKTFNTRNIRNGILVSMLTIMTVLPYYTSRYYKETGSFFPSNTQWLIPTYVQQAEDARDADRLEFFTALITFSDVHTTEGFTFRDYESLRLSDAWRDFWIKDQYLGPTKIAAKHVGKWLMILSPFLLLLGLLSWLRDRTGTDSFTALGWVLFGYAGVQVLAFLKYLYDNPWADWGPAKGMYVSALCLLIGYLFAQAFYTKRHEFLSYLGLVCAALLVVLTHGIPMY